MAKSKTHYYRIRSGGTPDEFTISKISEDLEVLAVYAIYPAFDGITCNCPSRKRPCKHMAMLHKFQQSDRIDAPEVLNGVTGRFELLNV